MYENDYYLNINKYHTNTQLYCIIVNFIIIVLWYLYACCMFIVYSMLYIILYIINYNIFIMRIQV